MDISEKAAYVKGLFDGMELDMNDKQNKILKALIDVVNDIAEEVSQLDQCYDEWLKSDGNIRDTLNFVVDERVDFIIDDYSKDDEKTKFDYSISDKTEEIPVGHIKYNDHEVIMYFSEKELLRDYKDAVNNSGINSVQVHINKNKDKPRHGLSYSITEEQYNQYGAEYSKEQYEKNYNKSQIKKKNKEVR